MRKFMYLALFTLWANQFVSGENMSITNGMNHDQVVQLLGSPTGNMTMGSTQKMFYTNLVVQLEEGLVISATIPEVKAQPAKLKQNKSSIFAVNKEKYLKEIEQLEKACLQLDQRKKVILSELEKNADKYEEAYEKSLEYQADQKHHNQTMNALNDASYSATTRNGETISFYSTRSSLLDDDDEKPNYSELAKEQSNKADGLFYKYVGLKQELKKIEARKKDLLNEIRKKKAFMKMAE